MDSSMSTKKKTKLSVRNQTCFKKSSLSSTAKKTTNLSLREQTMFKKASELSTLCDIEVCVIYYGRNGELIKTWPEDESKVRDMAERFNTLNERERRKKSTNLSQCLYKKMLNDKKTSFDNKDNKFYEKVLEMEGSLESHLRILQDKVRLLQPQNQTESDQSRVVSYSKDPPPHQQLMSGVSNTEQDLSTSSLSQHQSKFSVFLYNHDNGSFCQLPDSVSSFDPSKSTALLWAQGTGLRSDCNSFDLPMLFPTQLPDSVSTFDPSTSTASLGAQGSGLRSDCNNFDLPMMFPPQMQTENPLVDFELFDAWNQTQSFVDPMMFSSYN